jgi:hypothetical protein
LGQPVRYNGKALSFESDLIERWKALCMIVPLCPEIAAGSTLRAILCSGQPVGTYFRKTFFTTNFLYLFTIKAHLFQPLIIA